MKTSATSASAYVGVKRRERVSPSTATSSPMSAGLHRACNLRGTFPESTPAECHSFSALPITSLSSMSLGSLTVTGPALAASSSCHPMSLSERAFAEGSHVQTRNPVFASFPAVDRSPMLSSPCKAESSAWKDRFKTPGPVTPRRSGASRNHSRRHSRQASASQHVHYSECSRMKPPPPSWPHGLASCT